MEASINYDTIVKRIKAFNVKVREVEIVTSPDNVNNVVGYRRENLNKLKEFYDVDARVRQDDKIKSGKIEINVKKIYTDFLDGDGNV